MNPLARLWAWLNRDVDHDAVLDHVPHDNSISQRKLRKLRERAEQRHGRRFRTDEPALRVVEPSERLRHIESAGKKPVEMAEIKVRKIK